jgi:serine/threonine protein kinase
MNKYQTIRLLGNGSRGSVYLMRHIDTGELFAAKVINKKNVRETDVKKLKDYYIPRLVNHQPNILYVVDAYEDDNNFYILSEYFPSQDMFEFRIQDDLYTKVELALTIAKAIKSLHDANIIHRDIKLENVLIKKKIVDDKVTYIPLLIDFDLSCLDVKDSPYPCKGTVGTYIYAAPELFVKMPHDPKKTDIYSLGILFYLLFSDYKYPYKKFDLTKISEIIYQTLMTLPYNLETEYDLLNSLVMGMLEKNHQDRPNIDEIIAGLQNVLRIYPS